MKKIKYLTSVFILCFAVISVNSCKEEEESYQTFEAPNWYVNQPIYAVNMTAVVTLPSNLKPYLQTEDELAAFDENNSCRGVGTFINGLFYITIKGTSDDQSNIHFKYYSSRNKYMYKSANSVAFEPDLIYGTIDNPEILNLVVLK
ncbi:MAG: hypothetical protein JXQ69_00680 [Paludibacteraceae bacterium]|nr:hypothetical protein [Paludibacteraceae bacterium]MBN2786812.1 hypothetical protein [Paludibacteraceae bacterium]